MKFSRDASNCIYNIILATSFTLKDQVTKSANGILHILRIQYKVDFTIKGNLVQITDE